MKQELSCVDQCNRNTPYCKTPKINDNRSLRSEGVREGITNNMTKRIGVWRQGV